MFQRKQADTIASRMSELRRFIQIVIGPRQVGKSTAIRQALKKRSSLITLRRRMPRNRLLALGFGHSGLRRARLLEGRRRRLSLSLMRFRKYRSGLRK